MIDRLNFQQTGYQAMGYDDSQIIFSGFVDPRVIDNIESNKMEMTAGGSFYQSSFT